MAGVSVSDYGSHVVNDGSIGELCVRKTTTSFSLLPVMEQLGREQVLDLIWDSVVGVVYGGNEMDLFGAE